MAEITFEESLRQIRELGTRAEHAEKAGDWQEAVDSWRALLDHPCAHHQAVDYEILDTVHLVLRRAGRWDGAIAAKREAIAAGYRSVPDPEADIAEYLLAAGRRDEAAALFAELAERDPDDVWLYNSAAYSYAGVDDSAALRWARDGIGVALATGDPDQVVDQLLHYAERSWEALGEPPDEELVERVESFCETWQPVPIRDLWGDWEPKAERPCGYCGFDPDRTWADWEEMTRRRRQRRFEADHPEMADRLDEAFGGREPSRAIRREMALAVGWFPEEEWSVAVDRWPDLVDDLPADHRAYSHKIEARVKFISSQAPGQPMHISPLHVDELENHAAAGGHTPGSGEARSTMAAEVLERGDAVRWPPGRNERCWCGSNRKYKKCCGPVPAGSHDGT